MAKRGRRKRASRQASVSLVDSRLDATDEEAHVDIMSDVKRARFDAEEEIDVEHGGSCPGSPLVPDDRELLHSRSCPCSPVLSDETDLTHSDGEAGGMSVEGDSLGSHPDVTSMLPEGAMVRLDSDHLGPDFFDPTSDMHDLLLNASADSLMDIPLFNEVDTLMNIKNEDHFIDSVFYLPSSYTFEPTLKFNMSDNPALPDPVPLDIAASPVGAEDEAEQDSVLAMESQMATSPDTQTDFHTNTIHNSTDILGSSFLVTSDQGRPRALEHKLISGAPSGKKECGRKACSISQDSVDDAASEASGEEATGDSKADALVQVKPVDSEDLTEGSDSPLSSPGHTDTEASSQPQIDRFVICSDHTMECVLCAFTTDSYSAFKSHIICSHPCWRITKKLSKNRLLVEKSVRGGSSLQLLLAPHHNRCSSGACTKDNGVKPPRKCDRSVRKRQMFERNKRLFRCTVCLRLFVFEGSVVNHVSENHFQQERPYDYIHISNDHGQSFGPIYRCERMNCYFSCESADELERHGLAQHTAVIYRCQLCGYTADTAPAVHAHGLRMHQQQLTCFC